MKTIEIVFKFIVTIAVVVVDGTTSAIMFGTRTRNVTQVRGQRLATTLVKLQIVPFSAPVFRFVVKLSLHLSGFVFVRRKHVNVWVVAPNLLVDPIVIVPRAVLWTPIVSPKVQSKLPLHLGREAIASVGCIGGHCRLRRTIKKRNNNEFEWVART